MGENRQNEYVVLLPIGDSDGQVVILQLKEIDDETEEYVGVENEFVLETVFALYAFSDVVYETK